MNDVLGNLLQAADPGTVRRGDPLSERGQRELARYEAAEERLAGRRRAPRSWAWRPLQLATGAGVLAMILVAVIAFTVMRPTAAVAATPPMLDLRSVSSNAPELLKEMATMRSSGEAPSTTIRARSWSMNTSIAEDGTVESSQVEPQRSETVFEGDGTVRYRLVADEPFPGQDPTGLPEPGEVIAEETFAPGEWGFTAENGPPAHPGEVGAYLSAQTGEPRLTAGQTLREIAGMLSNYPLTRTQEAALVGYLATVDGIAVAGKAVDRLGRSGIVFSATDWSPGEYEDRLIISPATGEILATETIYIGSDRTDIASPSVVDYIAWER